MTTEILMVHALKRGLLIADFHQLSIGMILDYINQYDVLIYSQDHVNENTTTARQSHFDTF